MNKTKKNSKASFETFLKGTLSYSDFDALHTKLGVSKKMCTILLREPNKLHLKQILKLSELTKEPVEKLSEYIS